MNTEYVIIGGVVLSAASFYAGYVVGQTRAEKLAEQYINEEISNVLALAKESAGIEEEPTAVMEETDIPENEVLERIVEISGGDLYRSECERYISRYDEDADRVLDIQFINREVDPDDPESWEEHSAIVTIEEDGEEVQVFRTLDDIEDDLEDDEEFESLSEAERREQWRVGVISEDEFRLGMPGHTREEMTFYEDDEIVVGENGLPIDDYTMFGDGLSQFGMYGSPNDTCYIRNNELHLDMHIVKVRGSYEEEVLRQHRTPDYIRRMKEFEYDD